MPEALTLNQKKRRSSTRTGCISCKYDLQITLLIEIVLLKSYRARHVKCDERRPSCDRCYRYGIVYQGYPSKSLDLTWEQRHRLLEPRLIALPWVMRRYLRRLSSKMIKSTVTLFFCKDVLPSTRQSSVAHLSWTRIVLRETQNERFLRLACLVVSALNVALHTDDDSSHGSSSSMPTEINHYVVVLQLYQKAVQGMRFIESPKAALISCLLIFGFETMIERQDIAIAQVQSAFKVLKSLSIGSQAEFSTRAAELSSPESYIEDEVVRDFIYLEIQNIPFARCEPLTYQKAFYKYISPSREYIPAIGFSSFREAKEAREALECIKARGIGAGAFGRPWKESSNPIFEDSGGSWACAPSQPSSQMSSELCFVEISHWSTSFRSLLSAATSSLSAKVGEEYLRAISLQLRALYTKILLARRQFSTECAFDWFLHKFVGIVDLCKEHLIYPSFRNLPILQRGSSSWATAL